tara:strand:- start:2182 stop:5112 length:2931 start_codon:yes stop_codon:yes gene_type:complete
MNEILRHGLENLEMTGDPNQGSGLVSVHESAQNGVVSAEEFIALEYAKKYKVDFVYFRKFENRPSVAQVFIYDFTNRIGVEDQELTNLHKQLYSSALVPMFFVFTKKDVRIFNCYERPSEGDRLKYKPLTVIRLASKISDSLSIKSQEDFAAFSGKSFDNGTFWENSKYSKNFKFSNSAYEKLLSELKQALRDIIKMQILPAGIARKVMVTSILVRYLEEREDDEGRRVFPAEFFGKFIRGGQNFIDVFNKKGAYLELLDYLAQHFNGGIFQVSTEDRSYLKSADLSRFGLFLEGKAEGLQLVFWKLYSFNDLPVELISNIYEEFLGKQPGVVYTPPFLVNFLLDEAMPLESEATSFKILDPACGSGVFLVGAYRRLIHRWRRNNGWQRPSLSTLKTLLKDNIYGVELNKDAADLTIFSLSLALCDELTPLQIWEELKFDNLHERNILHDDFFNVITSDSFTPDFDLIIGNPPFDAKLTLPAKEVERKALLERSYSDIKQGLQKKGKQIKLPDNQIALLFLEQSVKLCKPQGLVCLIQPSGPFLYNNSSAQFRRLLFEKYHIPQIIDFTHISRILFGKNGDVATAAVFIKKEEAIDKGILHVTVRRTKPHKEKLYFELDTYDFHHVPKKLALYDPLIWKSNLFGGSRAHQLVNYLNSFEKLRSFLMRKKKEANWDFGEGFMRGAEGTKNSAFLTGRRALLAPQFKSNSIKISNLKENWFTSPRRESLFNPPLFLIKELIEVDNFKIPVYLSSEYLTFDSRIFGISSNNEDIEDLKNLANSFDYFNSVYSYFITLTSSQFSVNFSSAIRADDIYNLPCILDPHQVILNSQEQIILNDTIEYLLEFRRHGETSKIAMQNVSPTELQKYGTLYCEILGKIYPTIKPYQYFETSSYICFPFYFGEKEPDIDFTDSDEAEKHIESLVRKNLNLTLRLNRIVRMYEGNVIYLIKPKKLRYWLQSIALRDADETFADLRKQGY